MPLIVERISRMPASPAELWAVLSDFGAISAWAPNVDHSCLMSHQVEGVGVVRRIQASRATLVEVVEIWEPSSVLSYRIEGLPPVVRRLTNTWHLEPAGDSTTVVLTSSIETGPRPPQKLLARVIGRRLAHASEQMLAGLNDHLLRLDRPLREEHR